MKIDLECWHKFISLEKRCWRLFMEAEIWPEIWLKVETTPCWNYSLYSLLKLPFVETARCWNMLKHVETCWNMLKLLSVETTRCWNWLCKSCLINVLHGLKQKSINLQFRLNYDDEVRIRSAQPLRVVDVSSNADLRGACWGADWIPWEKEKKSGCERSNLCRIQRLQFFNSW